MRDFDTLPTPHPQFPLPELDRAIEALIAFRDAFDGYGDPPEDDDPPESDGIDQGDPAWPEWHGRGRHKEAFARGFGHRMSEDYEDDDASENDDPAEDGGDTEPNGDEGDYTDWPGCRSGPWGIDQSRSLGPDNPEAK
jgi:hypothetical protein